MPIFDTTYLVDARRDPQVAAKVQGWADSLGEPCLVPMQAAIEFAAGIEPPNRGLMQLEEGFEIVPMTLELGRVAAHMAKEAFARGRFPGWADLQIAATAMYEGMTVVSRNAPHFRALEVPVWDYVQEPPPLQGIGRSRA